MAWLLGKKGEHKSKWFHVSESGVFYIGRKEKYCQLFLDDTNVSRTHARIIRSGDRYFLEDPESRNKTYLNRQQITGNGKFLLCDRDSILICDHEFEFYSKDPHVQSSEPHSTMEASVSESSKDSLQLQATDKMAKLLEIGFEIGKLHKKDEILNHFIDELFRYYDYGDRAFIIQTDEMLSRFTPKLIRARSGNCKEIGFSTTIIRSCLEEKQAVLYRDDNNLPTDDISSGSIFYVHERSVICASLSSSSGRSHGVIWIDTTKAGRRFNVDDLRFVHALSGIVANALESADHMAMERDLRLAQDIQRSFLPAHFPCVPGYEFAAYYDSAQEVGGDYYDFIELADGRLVMLLGDVAGKGVPASLVMAKFSAVARFAFLSETNFAQAVINLNRQMFHISQHDKFVTLSVAVLDPKAHTLSLINAGHEIPLLINGKTGKIAPVMERDGGGYPIGFFDDSEYEDFTVPFEQGDVLLIFSDGVIDARDQQQQRFNLDGILDALAGTPADPNTITTQLVSSLERHSLDAGQVDDITILAVGRKK